MEKIISLAEISLDEIFEAFSIAFKDYEMQLNKHEFYTMINRRGFNKELSFGAIDNGKLVSFTLNGIGNYLDYPTAYDTGTGTIEEYRGSKLAGKIFEYSVPFLKEAGIKKYLLEVLQHNKSAVSVYKKAGFIIRREFAYYVLNNSQLSRRLPPYKHKVNQISINDIKEAYDFMDFEPSWQNSINAIERNTEMFISLGVKKKDKLLGYAVFEPNSGDVTLLAVEKNHRKLGIGCSLLFKMTQLNNHKEIKIINAELKCESFIQFMKSLEVGYTGKQFEMIRDL